MTFFGDMIDGRTLKHLTVAGEFTHEGLMIHLDRSLTSSDVIHCLGYLFELYGVPACIISDNGPKFVAKRVLQWLKGQQVKVRYIDPGSPWQNGHIESFNGVCRNGCLGRWPLYSVPDAGLTLKIDEI